MAPPMQTCFLRPYFIYCSTVESRTALPHVCNSLCKLPLISGSYENDSAKWVWFHRKWAWSGKIRPIRHAHAQRPLALLIILFNYFYTVVYTGIGLRSAVCEVKTKLLRSSKMKILVVAAFTSLIVGTVGQNPEQAACLMNYPNTTNHTFGLQLAQSCSSVIDFLSVRLQQK